VAFPLTAYRLNLLRVLLSIEPRSGKMSVRSPGLAQFPQMKRKRNERAKAATVVLSAAA
jgi:hypothetical protein